MRRSALVVLGTLAACAVALALFLALDRSPTATAPAPRQVSSFDGPTAPASMPAIDFALRDAAGALVRLRSYRGEPIVLAFIDSTCVNLCPVVAEQLRGALGELTRPVGVIAISVDPAQDSAAHVRRFLAAADLTGRVAYIAGPRRSLAPIWRFFGVQPEVPTASRRANFSLDIELLDKSGKPRVGYTELDELDPDAIAHDIEALESEATPRRLPRRLQLP
jgi:protein SCO1/2